MTSVQYFESVHFKSIMEEWLISFVVLGATVVVALCTRALLKKLHKDRGWTVFRELAPSISNVIYIFGLKIFAEVAPLRGRIEVWVDGAIYVLAVIFFLLLVQKAVLIGIDWTSLKSRPSDTLKLGFGPLLRNTITLFIFFMGIIMILKYFNYDVMSLVTALGVSSLAVGLAAKDTLSNMISGFILIIDRNLAPGDRINLGGTVGDVKEIGLRSTQLQMSEGNILIVPNTELVNTKILNLSMPNREITCSSKIRVPCSVPFLKVKDMSLSVLSKLENVNHERTPWVYLENLSDGHQALNIGFWVKDLNSSSVTVSDFNQQLLDSLQKEKIPLLSPLGASSSTIDSTQLPAAQ